MFSFSHVSSTPRAAATTPRRRRTGTLPRHVEASLNKGGKPCFAKGMFQYLFPPSGPPLEVGFGQSSILRRPFGWPSWIPGPEPGVAARCVEVEKEEDSYEAESEVSFLEADEAPGSGSAGGAGARAGGETYDVDLLRAIAATGTVGTGAADRRREGLAKARAAAAAGEESGGTAGHKFYNDLFEKEGFAPGIPETGVQGGKRDVKEKDQKSKSIFVNDEGRCRLMSYLFPSRTPRPQEDESECKTDSDCSASSSASSASSSPSSSSSTLSSNTPTTTTTTTTNNNNNSPPPMEGNAINNNNTTARGALCAPATPPTAVPIRVTTRVPIRSHSDRHLHVQRERPVSSRCRGGQSLIGKGRTHSRRSMVPPTVRARTTSRSLTPTRKGARPTSREEELTNNAAGAGGCQQWAPSELGGPVIGGGTLMRKQSSVGGQGGGLGMPRVSSAPDFGLLECEGRWCGGGCAGGAGGAMGSTGDGARYEGVASQASQCGARCEGGAGAGEGGGEFAGGRELHRGAMSSAFIEAYAGEAAESAAESAAGEFQESQSACGGELLTRGETFEEQCAKRSKDLRAQCGYRERPVDDSPYGCMGLWPDGSKR